MLSRVSSWIKEVSDAYIDNKSKNVQLVDLMLEALFL